MCRMKPLNRFALAVAILAVVSGSLTAQQEGIDTVALRAIKEEGLRNSQVMDLLGTLCDVYGPRLSWSPEYRRAAEWVTRTLKGWGITAVRYDAWAPLGRGWTLKDFSATVTAPV